MAETPKNVVYRWDLDKTYLRTDFDSVRGLVRTAFESAGRKKTVSGAATLVKQLQANSNVRTSILSGSPQQMRPVLERKLQLDGIHWDEFVLKPSLQHILRWRLRTVKGQLAYKFGALLESRKELDEKYDEVLFGDDSEADAYIYCLYADVLAERVSLDMLLRVLEESRLYPHEVFQIMRLASGIRKRDCVSQIFIHLDRVSDPETFSRLGNRVVPIYNYFEAALVLYQEGHLKGTGLLSIARELAAEAGFGRDILAASYLDMVRRRRVQPEKFRILYTTQLSRTDREAAGIQVAFKRWREAISDSLELQTGASVSAFPDSIDYVELLHIDRQRQRDAKQRVRWRRRLI